MSALSVFDSGPPPPCPAPFNLAAYVLAAADTTPDKTALEVVRPSGVERHSFAELRSAVLSVGASYLNLGLTPGDRVLLRLGNTIEFPLHFLGLIAAGLVPVPTSTLLTKPEVQALVDEMEPAVIVCDDPDGVPVSAGCKIVLPEMFASMQSTPTAGFHKGDPNALAYIIYTSGTSGRPRAVMHAHRAVWARRMMWTGWYGLRASDRVLHAGSFNWTYTLGTGLCDPWACGATAIVYTGKKDRAVWPGLLVDACATIFAATPGVLRQFLEHTKARQFPHLRHGLSAGERLPDPVRAKWSEMTGTPVFEAMGMSEVSTFISENPALTHRPGTLGRPQPGRRVAVVTEDGAPVAIGEAGILAVSVNDPGLMLGYSNAVDEMAAKTKGEWFLTGDTISMDVDGYATYLGRTDDMMNAGGFRVSPLEVEDVVNSHPDVEESAAAEFEVRDDVWVIGVWYSGAERIDDTDLSDYCAARLARYKCPRVFHHVKALPKGANEKLQRRALAQLTPRAK